MNWIFAAVLLAGFVIGRIYEARKSINQVMRDWREDEADAAYRRQATYEMDRYNEISSRPE